SFILEASSRRAFSTATTDSMAASCSLPSAFSERASVVLEIRRYEAPTTTAAGGIVSRRTAVVLVAPAAAPVATVVVDEIPAPAVAAAAWLWQFGVPGLQPSVSKPGIPGSVSWKYGSS